MAVNRSWEEYPTNYRAKEMKRLAGWIVSGESGSVVGLVGCGRSNLLGFLCYRPELLETHTPDRARPFALIPVDLNDLPARDASTLYRVILRSFDRVRDRFEPSLQRAAADLYRETRAERDPFLPQSALHELLLMFREQEVQVVLVLNRFDRFCQNATPAMINTLRALRDSFKDTLCYIVGMRQEVAYLHDPTALGDMYDLLDSHLCWVGPMSDDDARWMIDRNTNFAPVCPSEAEVSAILSLAGNFPSLLKAISSWWLSRPDKPPIDEWKAALLAERSIRYRLTRIWDGLTQEEQLVLAAVQKMGTGTGDQERGGGENPKGDFEALTKEHRHTLERLEDKGLCARSQPGWRIFGVLLNHHVGIVGEQALGKIWMDKYEQIHQGRKLVDVRGLQKRILVFFITNPHKQHTHNTIIDNAWPEDELREGITSQALYFHIKELRKKIEPDPDDFRYIVGWRGKPEGGYQFFPEGRPRLESPA